MAPNGLFLNFPYINDLWEPLRNQALRAASDDLIEKVSTGITISFGYPCWIYQWFQAVL